MIDQLAALGKVNSIGRDGFIWWIGQIAHKDSWRAPNKLITRQDGNQTGLRLELLDTILLIQKEMIFLMRICLGQKLWQILLLVMVRVDCVKI